LISFGSTASVERAGTVATKEDLERAEFLMDATRPVPQRRTLDDALCLPAEYVSRVSPEFYDDDQGDLVWQPDVYGLAAVLADRLDSPVVVDVGCGRATKLQRVMSGRSTIGIDIRENVDWCRSVFPAGTWLEADLEHDIGHLVADVPGHSLAICADVIEHLVDPRHLLAGLRALRERGVTIVLSTPERDRVYGPGNLGPPGFGAHVREWRRSEFALLLESAGLPAQAIGTTRSNFASDHAATICAVIVPEVRDVPTAIPKANTRLADLPAILASASHATAADYIEEAVGQGYCRVGITSVELIPGWQGDVVGSPLPSELVISEIGTRGLAPLNLVGAPIGSDPAKIAQLARDHLPISVTGIDPTMRWWPSESRRFMVRNEAQLAGGFEEAHKLIADLRSSSESIESDLRRQLDDALRQGAALTAQINASSEEVARLEGDVLRRHLNNLTQQFGDLTHQVAELQRANDDDEQRRESDRREHRAELTAEAKQRLLCHPNQRVGSARLNRFGTQNLYSALRRRGGKHAAALSAELRSPRCRQVAQALVLRSEAPSGLPAWLFDKDWYVRQDLGVRTRKVSAAAHYQSVGWRLGRSPHPLFASSWYLSHHPEVAELGIDPARHFCSVGWAQGFDPHPMFSVSWYLDRWPDVAAAGLNPLEHYLRFGWREERDPHPLFDTAWYKRFVDELAEPGLVHFVAHGAQRGFSPSALLDVGYYRASYPDVELSGLEPYWYYLEVGVPMGDRGSERSAVRAD
jgi:hypothetical protein